MGAYFAAPSYPGDRLCLVLGPIVVGAVFPPVGHNSKWRWSCFQTGDMPSKGGTEKTEQEAKAALRAEFNHRLALMGLNEIGGR